MMRPSRAGKLAEDTIASVLRSCDIEFGRQVVIARSIYDRKLKIDFVLRNLVNFPKGLGVEAKWQDRSGTTDEKFPYVVYNIQQRLSIPAIVIVCGGGFCVGSLRWLREQCDGQHLIAVFNLEEFMSWAHRAEKLVPSAQLAIRS